MTRVRTDPHRGRTVNRHEWADGRASLPLTCSPRALAASRLLPAWKIARAIVLVCGLPLLLSAAALAQVVDVTVALDTNQVAIGSTTTLHLYAQVIPSLRTNVNRIFSWYVDFLDADGAVALPTYDHLHKATSDQDPRASSDGVTDGANQLGIYDSFINLPGAGVAQPVELFSVPIKGLAEGIAHFSVHPGTTVSNLIEDFIVAPNGGGPPLLGGDYSTATVQLSVVQGVCQPTLSAVLETSVSSPAKVMLTFSPCPGQTHFVEFTNDLGSNSWQALPGAPHNSGSVTDNITGTRRFYRVRLAPPG